MVWRVGGGHLRRHLPAPVVGVIGCRTELVQRPQAGVGHDRGETVGVTGDPVGHVSAERAAHRRDPGRIDARMRTRRIGRRHQVVERRSAPRSPAALDEVLAVAGRQCGIGQQHRVALGGHQPRIPSPGPVVPAAQRAAVHPQQQRGRRMIFGQHQPGPHRCAICDRRGDLGQCSWQRLASRRTAAR